MLLASGASLTSIQLEEIEMTMKHTPLTLALFAALSAHAQCLPKEAAGTGTPLQLHFAAEGTVIGWRCGGVFEWLGVRQQEFIPFGVEDLLIRQLQRLKAENAADPALRASLGAAARTLELRSK